MTRCFCKSGNIPWMDRLSATSITVWSARLDKPSQQVERYLTLLSLEERTRAERYRLVQHRQRFIAARGQLRLLLSQYIEQPPETITIDYNEHGKPYLVDSRLQFNLAHVNDEMLCAFTWDYTVGIDIEDTRREVEIMTVARLFFAADEVIQLEAQSPDTQRLAFFDLWTRKESYLKARGTGLKFDRHSTSVPAGGKSFLSPDGTHWSILSFSHAPHMRAALVTSAPTLSMSLRTFDG